MAAVVVVAIDLDRNLLAELLPAGAAMVALRAALIMVHHHALADLGFLRPDTGTDRNHHTAGLMAGDHVSLPHRDAAGLGAVLGATVLVQVAAAHARRLHFDNDIVGVGGRIGELHQFQFTLAMKHHPAHR